MRWLNALTRAWYQPTIAWPYFLSPFAAVYKLIILIRAWWFKYYKNAVTHFNIPVIVVGNITVGGTGKTPLVIWLAQYLQQQGYQPGIVSRGYGGNAKQYPLLVTEHTDPMQSGDEAVLIAKRTQCPVVVAPRRVKAVEYLLAHANCNIVISDDGLQHYALGRKIEIVVVDGERRFGNEKCLPAGPLREPLSRLASVDFIVTNGKAFMHEYTMQLQPGIIYNLAHHELTANPDDFLGQPLHAIAGIGNPERFFTQLRDLGLTIWPHPFPDHHRYTQQDIQFEHDAKIIMTEKDAVKCTHLIDYRYWCLPVTAQLDDNFGKDLLAKLK